jgi:hypothetical protein
MIGIGTTTMGASSVSESLDGRGLSVVPAFFKLGAGFADVSTAASCWRAWLIASSKPGSGQSAVSIGWIGVEVIASTIILS